MDKKTWQQKYVGNGNVNMDFFTKHVSDPKGILPNSITIFGSIITSAYSYNTCI